MTEYDYSPEAYEQYIATQQRISKWVDNTEGYRNEFGNALTVSPSMGSYTSTRQAAAAMQPVTPPQRPLRSSQSQYFHPVGHIQPQSSLTPSRPHLVSPRQYSAADLRSLHSQHSIHHHPPHSAQVPQVPPSSHVLSPTPSRPHLGSSPHYSSADLRSLHSQHSNLHPTQVAQTPVVPLSHHASPSPSRKASSINLRAPALHHTHTSTTYVHPQAPRVLSRHPSIVDIQGPRSQHATVHNPSELALTPKSGSLQAHPQTAPSNQLHLISPATVSLETPSLQSAPANTGSAYMVKIPPSDKPTYIYAASGPSAGLVIVPENGHKTSIVVSPGASQVQVPMIQAHPHSYTRPGTPMNVTPYCTPLGTPQQSPHHFVSPGAFPPGAYGSISAYQPVAPQVIIIERSRRSKSSGKKSKRKEKRSKSEARA